ncbi:MAG: methionyl-tRNA formyltransferase [Planctomycetia bacterium]|nr:methionyl-tRNA formyltransferase [Planctomycetia bacterium]
MTVKPLRIVVMGTGPFAVPMFEALRDSPHGIVAVVTRPDHAPPGRRPPRNPMRDAATAAGIGILDPERINEPTVIASLAALRPDLFVVCDYGQILSRDLLAVPPLGGINLHGSLLPRHRGAAPVQWAIREGDAVSGVSVIHMTPALDAGNVIVARSTPIGPRETAAELEPRLAALGVDAVIEAIERLQAAWAATGSVAGVGMPQETPRATRAPRLTKADGVVDWSLPAVSIERLRRALDPWPRLTAVFTRGDGQTQRLVLEDVVVVPPAAGALLADAAAPGTVLDTKDGRIVVACGEGTAIAIMRLVPEGRRSMSAAEFLRGSPLMAGSRLG